MKLKLKNMIMLLAVSAALAAGGCGRGSAAPEESAGDKLYEQVRSVDHLVLAQMKVEKMATIDDLSLQDAKGPEETVDALIDAIKIGDRVAVYSYDTYLEGYIDLAELAPEDVAVDEATRRVRLTLPGVRTRYAGRDAAIREVHYRVTGLRSGVDARERALLKERMGKSLRKEMASNNEYTDRLKMKAEESAKKYFTNLLASSGYKAEIKFKEQ